VESLEIKVVLFSTPSVVDIENIVLALRSSPGDFPGDEGLLGGGERFPCSGALLPVLSCAAVSSWTAGVEEAAGVGSDVALVTTGASSSNA
jgi:hypothetical protein